MDLRHEHVARTLGASTARAFLRVTLPMSVRGVLIGVILTWFRAMAEFGSLRIMANRPRGYVVYQGYGQPVQGPGCYWASQPVYDYRGRVVGYSGQPVQVCPGY